MTWTIIIYLLLCTIWFIIGFKLIVTRADFNGMDNTGTVHLYVSDCHPAYSNSLTWLRSIKDPMTTINFLVYFLSLPFLRLPTVVALLSSENWVKSREVPLLDDKYGFFLFNFHYHKLPSRSL